MRTFIIKLWAVFMFLACVLVLENILMGHLPMLLGMLLLCVCSAITLRSFRAALRKPARRHRKTTSQRAPTLRVVNGAHVPHGPRAA